MVGSLWGVGSGALTMDDLKNSLHSPLQPCASGLGKAAPADGLYLKEIKYDEKN